MKQKSFSMKSSSPLENVINKSRGCISFGAFAFATGIILAVSKSWVMDYLPASIIVLKEGSPIAKAWLKTPEPLQTNIYFFNWTNPEDILNHTTKPKFEEIGPYVFKQDLEKVNVSWNANNTITYKLMRTFVYDAEKTTTSMDYNITSLNVLTYCMSHYVRHWNFFIKKSMSAFFSTFYPDISLTKTAQELLIDGYKNFLIDFSHFVPFIAPDIPRFDKFGWMMILNRTADLEGVITTENGYDGTFNVTSWNYDNETIFDGSCAPVRGSPGELYKKKLSRDSIRIFFPNLCRDLLLDYEEDTYVNGILGYKFIIGDGTLDNGAKRKENSCYCTDKCMPSGVINASLCRHGLPAMLSLPHFYFADPVYLEPVEGLKPNRSKHESYLIIEPNTGVPIKAVMRAQLNMDFHPDDEIMIFSEVPKFIFPILWAEVDVELPHHLILLLKAYLMLPYILIALSTCLILVGGYIFVFVIYRPLFIALLKRLYTTKQNSAPKPAEEVPLKVDMEMGLLNEVLLKDEST